MFSWLKSFFGQNKELVELAPKLYNVGKATALVTLDDGTCRGVIMQGRAYNMWESVSVFDAHHSFSCYLERIGKTKMVHLGNGDYVPINRVKSLTVKYESYEVEAEE